MSTGWIVVTVVSGVWVAAVLLGLVLGLAAKRGDKRRER